MKSRSLLRVLAVASALISTAPVAPAADAAAPASEQPSWWKELVIYQVYPRSFKDSNGDGIGDLRGIVGKLDYLADLGVNAIWLNPVNRSPNADNGYDISDHYSIMDEFGTMADYEELVAQARKRGIRIIMDFVGDYTSDEHRWFKEASKSRDNPYHDYYIWHDPVNGGVPNDWVSFFGGSAWEFNRATGEYYLHHFTARQPNLN